MEEGAAPRGVPMFVSANNDWWRMRIGSDTILLAVSRLAEGAGQGVGADDLPRVDRMAAGLRLEPDKERAKSNEKHHGYIYRPDAS